MGDPKRQKNKYSRPSHPWQASRIREEAVLMDNYALKNKKEIWKAASFIKKYKNKAKQIIASKSAQAKLEEKQILSKLIKLNLLPQDSKIEDVLDLNITTVLERRLQTLVYKKGFARTPSQARQFIIHGHITLNGNGLNLPSYLVSLEEEPFIGFYSTSALKNEEHPERKIKEKPKPIEKKEATAEDGIIEEVLNKEIKEEVKNG